MAFQTIEHHVDFCVVGGGLAGMCAAIAAARDGMTVHSNPDYPQFLTVVGNYTAFKPAEAVNERDLDTASKQPEMKTATGFFARIVAFFAKITAFFTRLFHLIG